MFKQADESASLFFWEIRSPAKQQQYIEELFKTTFVGAPILIALGIGRRFSFYIILVRALINMEIMQSDAERNKREIKTKLFSLIFTVLIFW